MNENRFILLVEDDPDHAHLIKRHLQKIERVQFEIDHVRSLAHAKRQLETGQFDAVLLDLSLPDSPINQTLEKVVETGLDAPVIVLTSISDLEFASKAVQQGAQDYLVKSEINRDILNRSIRYAIERNRTQQELERYAAKLKESNEHLEGFAHTLAHEIRSPLTVISGFLQIANQSFLDDLDENTREILQDSLTATKSITELVESLLEFSQAATHTNTFKSVDLESEFFHVYAVLRPLIQESGVTIDHDPLPCVYGNDIQLRQLLQNLLTNAIKYRSDQSPEINVGCEQTDNHWIIRVSDNGIGIPKENQSDIFNAFTRVIGNQQIPGVGIGLAFCKRIVENHKGKIWLESLPGKGSTFFVKLPKSIN